MLEEQILGMPVSVVLLIIMGLVTVLVSFLVSLAVSMRNGEDTKTAAEQAANDALDKWLSQEEWIETVEYVIDENVPEAVQNVGAAVLAMIDRYADDTATELDDKTVQLLTELLGDGVSELPGA